MLKLAVFHNGVMNAAVQVSFSRIPHYKTQVNLRRQSIHKALVKYGPIHSEATPQLLISSSAFQLP